MRDMDTKNRAPKRWLRIILPAVLIVVWLVVGSVGGPTFGKISGVTSNEQSSFLPASAESTVVLDWQGRFLNLSLIHI